MTVRFSDEARAKLRAIHLYLAKESRARADAMIERIVRRTAQIDILPHMGRKVVEFGRDDLREVAESPYRIIYRIKPEAIEIVTVMHYRQLLPDDLL